MGTKEREFYKKQIDDIEEIVTMMIVSNKDNHSIIGSLDSKTQAELATQLVLNHRGTTVHKALEPVAYNGAYL